MNTCIRRISTALVIAGTFIPIRAADMDTISARVLAEYQTGGGSSATIKSWLDSLKPDGTWPDINYADTGRATWAPSTHVSRMLSMAQSYFNPSNKYHDSVFVKNGFLLAFDGWIRIDPQSPNWWWNDIGTQLSLGPAMLIMKGQLSKAQLDSGDVIMARSWAVHATMTGDNLVWVSKITIWRGCIMDSASLIAEAVAAITGDIMITSQPSDGLQQDWSFHQHGPQIYSGGYGMGFSGDGSDVAQLCRGTQFAFSTDKLDLMTHYILDGQQWMVRGTTMDHSVCGREITRPNSPNKKNSFTTLCLNMQLATPERTAEYSAFSNRINTWPASLPTALCGNIHFWCSDYMAHQRNGYMASVKMSSTRTVGAELVNGEGLKSYYLGDGVTFYYRGGNEYFNLFPVLDWTRLPGVTCQHDVAPPTMPSNYKGTTNFVGGVSDGVYGVTGFDYSRNGVIGRKALFFFDKEIVALGAGIKSTGTMPVYTSVNQCFQHGPVTVSTGGVQSTLAAGTHSMNNLLWVYHDSIGYFPLQSGTGVTIRNDTQTGTWYGITAIGAQTPVTDTVFSFWFDHGIAPAAANYAYAVVPGIGLNDVDAYVKNGKRCRLVIDSTRCQAVRDDSLGVCGLVFYSPDTVRITDSLAVSADRACIALVRETRDSVAIAVANPLNTACTLHVIVSTNLTGADASWNAKNKTTLITFIQPGGLEAGRSVVKSFVRASRAGIIQKEPARGQASIFRSDRTRLIFTPDADAKQGMLLVYSSSGRVLAVRQIENGPVNIDMRNIPTGVIFAQVRGRNSTQTLKLTHVK